MGEIHKPFETHIYRHEQILLSRAHVNNDVDVHEDMEIRYLRHKASLPEGVFAR